MLLLRLLACAHPVPPAATETVPAAELAFLQRNHARAVDGGPPAIGREVAIKGWAATVGETAVVVREQILVRCLDRAAWPEGVEDGFVTVRGVLARRDAPPPEMFRAKPREILFETLGMDDAPGAGLYEIARCDVTVGATDADVLPEQLAALRVAENLQFPGGVPTVGAEVIAEGIVGDVGGELSFYGAWPPGRPDVWFEARCPSGFRGVVRGQRLRIRGTLRFQPARYLEGAYPPALVKPCCGPFGRFYIETCDTEQIGG